LHRRTTIAVRDVGGDLAVSIVHAWDLGRCPVRARDDERDERISTVPTIGAFDRYRRETAKPVLFHRRAESGDAPRIVAIEAIRRIAEHERARAAGEADEHDRNDRPRRGPPAYGTHRVSEPLRRRAGRLRR
jgi:hypothetical protein